MYLVEGLVASAFGGSGPAFSGDDPAVRWYAIQTHPRAEEKVIIFLARNAITTFLPKLLVERHHGSRRWHATEPLFPGYLFVRFAPKPYTLDRVRWTPGVRKILGDERAPSPVPEDAMTFLQERVGDRGFITPGLGVRPGMRVRFTSGPLVYLEGIVERVAPRAKRVRVLLQLLNRCVPVEAGIAELEPV